MEPADLWDDLRQGARNVAGVTWQTSVCVYLLVAGFAGELPFVRITPEGFEDADCESADGARTYVQVKELDAGRGRLAAAAVADALAHADVSGHGSTIALVTDGTLGSGLAFTGWTTHLADQQVTGVSDVVSSLVDRGYAEARARGIVARAQVVQLPFRVREISERLLAASTGCHPAVAALVVSPLTDMLASLSADQRNSHLDTATRIRTSDVEAVLSEIQQTVDVDGLDRAQTLGICGPADFVTSGALSMSTFYLGVDGSPGHIAANLDVLRPNEMRDCADGLANEESVLIVGPSGAGKSILLWRVARDLLPAARVLRVSRVASPQDAAELARHVRLMRPGQGAPVLVVIDDLGRAATICWQEAASRLREIPHTLLLAASRAEDFRPNMLVGSTRVVLPQLDRDSASEIASRIREAGITQRMDVLEAFDLSEGLLMEFIALLTTGQHLRQVLAAQVAALAVPDRRLQRDVARLLTAAHTLGLSLSAQRLAGAFPTLDDASLVGDALEVLRGEHVVVEEGISWCGLHELRSTILCGLLHESPPPTLGSTWSRVMELVNADEAGWMLRRIAERDPAAIPELMDVVHRLIAQHCSAADAARLLEGAERADNALYVKATMPILLGVLPPNLTIETLATFAYPMRNQGLSWDSSGSNGFARMAAQLGAVARSMPLRTDFDETLKAASAPLTPELLERLLDGASVADTVRLLEAGRGYLTVPADLIRSLIARTPPPHDVVAAMQYSRLIAACARHTPSAQYEAVLGPVADRALAVAAADPWTLDVTIDLAAHSMHVLRMLPAEPTLPPSMVWDIPRAHSSDVVNTDTVASLERLVDACPELTRFEIRTVDASGEPYRILDHEPGHKDMARSAFPVREAVRQSVGYQAALRRATASQTWTEVVTEQIELANELVALSREIPLRLKPNDNHRRRSEWTERLGRVRARLTALDPPPLERQSSQASDEAHFDDADRVPDSTTRALTQAADALDRLCPTQREAPRPLATAVDLRDAAAGLRTARAGGRTVLGHLGSTIPDELLTSLERAANLAAALHHNDADAKLIRADDPESSADEIFGRAREDAATRTKQVLMDRLGAVPGVTVTRVTDADPGSWSLDDSAWLITTPVAGLDNVASRLGSLTDSERDAIGQRVVVIAVGLLDSDHDVGIKGRSASSDPLQPDRVRVSLDMGFQIGHTAATPLLPLTPAMATAWATAGGLHRMVDSNRRPVSALDALVLRSMHAARTHLRRLPSPASAPNQAVQPEPLDHTPTSAEPDVWLGSAAAGEALRLLEVHVSAEEAGSAVGRPLAAVILRSVTASEPTEEEQALLGAIAVLHFSHFDDIEGLSPE